MCKTKPVNGSQAVWGGLLQTIQAGGREEGGKWHLDEKQFRASPAHTANRGIGLLRAQESAKFRVVPLRLYGASELMWSVCEKQILGPSRLSDSVGDTASVQRPHLETHVVVYNLDSGLSTLSPCESLWDLVRCRFCFCNSGGMRAETP